MLYKRLVIYLCKHKVIHEKVIFKGTCLLSVDLDNYKVIF